MGDLKLHETFNLKDEELEPIYLDYQRRAIDARREARAVGDNANKTCFKRAWTISSFFHANACQCYCYSLVNAFHFPLARLESTVGVGMYPGECWI